MLINYLECWNILKSRVGFAFESHHLEQRTAKKHGLLIVGLRHSQTIIIPQYSAKQGSFTAKFFSPDAVDTTLKIHILNRKNQSIAKENLKSSSIHLHFGWVQNVDFPGAFVDNQP